MPRSILFALALAACGTTQVTNVYQLTPDAGPAGGAGATTTKADAGAGTSGATSANAGATGIAGASGAAGSPSVDADVEGSTGATGSAGAAGDDAGGDDADTGTAGASGSAGAGEPGAPAVPKCSSLPLLLVNDLVCTYDGYYYCDHGGTLYGDCDRNWSTGWMYHPEWQEGCEEQLITNSGMSGNNDPLNCGACGHVCAPGFQCIGGKCSCGDSASTVCGTTDATCYYGNCNCADTSVVPETGVCGSP